MLHCLMKEYDVRAAPAPVVIKEKAKPKPAPTPTPTSTSWFNGTSSKLLSMLSSLPWNKQPEPEPESETPHADADVDADSQCYMDPDTMFEYAPREIFMDSLPRKPASWNSLFVNAKQPIPKLPHPFKLTHRDIMAEVKKVSNILDDIGARLRVTNATPEQEDAENSDTEVGIVDPLLGIDTRNITNQEMHYILLRRQLASCPHYTKAEIADYFGTDEGCGEGDDDDTGYVYVDPIRKEPVVIGDGPAVDGKVEDKFEAVEDLKTEKQKKKGGVIRRLGAPFRWLRKKV